MPENAKTPEIRFAGFTDAWEERKLGDIALIIMGQSPNSSNYTDNPDDHILVQGNADMKNGRVTPRVWTTQITKKGEKGDLILSIRAPVGDVGKTDFPVVLGRGVAAIRGNEFLYQSFLRMKQIGCWDKLCTGSTFDSINSNDIRESRITVPAVDEQARIGQLFASLDRLVALHQREYDKTVNIKKAMLEKMFPKEGADKPEIRFAGFTDAWEKRKLGEVTKSYSGGTPTVGKSEYYGGHIPFIRSAEINSGTTELFLTESGLQSSSAKMVNVGDILYALYGATSGEVGIAKIQGAINQAIFAIKPDDGYDSQFIMQWLRGQKQKIIDKYLQGGQGNLSGSLVKDLLVKFPSDGEQAKIGAFFSNLDRLITLHRRELEKLQNMKKALLEKMFV